MRNPCLLFLLPATLLFARCSNQANVADKEPKAATHDAAPPAAADTAATASVPSGPAGSAAEIMDRPEVPVLCYHHIRYPKPGKKLDEYSVTPEEFKSQMKGLADSGYHTVSPDQLHAYLTRGAKLPAKPVVLTYDDTDEEQFTIAKAEMDKYNFKGVYFIMTISIGRPRYMSAEQIKQLADEGHTIASHTWRHDRVDRYVSTPHFDKGLNKQVNNDWDMQLLETRKKLNGITGKPVEYFAYPFGIWSKEGIPEIRNRGYKLAFQLSTKRDPDEPLYTVRRIIVPPSWDGAKTIRVMKSAFKGTW